MSKKREQPELSLDEQSQNQTQPHHHTPFGTEYRELDADTLVVYHTLIIKKDRLVLRVGP